MLIIGRRSMNRTEFKKALVSGIKFFRMIGNYDDIARGEIVEFHHDDATDCPSFYYPNREWRDTLVQNDEGDRRYIFLSDLIPLSFEEQEEILNPKTGMRCQSNSTDTNSHYCIDGIQPIQYCQRCLTPEQFQGACIKDVIKYLSRFGKKDEKIREAEKALDYALWLYMSVAGKDVDPTKHNHEAIFKALEIE